MAPGIADNRAMADLATRPETPDTLTTLRRLVLLRWWLLAGELLAILAVPPLLAIPLPAWPMLAVVLVQLVVNGLAWRRSRQAEALAAGELFRQLALDLGAFSVLMFFSGGAANPLIFLLLLPVAVAALALPAPWVAGVLALAVFAYSLLMVSYLPLAVADADRAARLHLAGMWLTFVVSAAMVAWLVVRMTASIRRRDAQLAAAREQALRDERVIALGALAAGAAHELGTPLATIAVIAGELERENGLDEAVKAEIAVLKRQVAACKSIISGLAERAGAGRLESARATPVDDWLAAVFARWQGLRPQAQGRLELEGVRPAPRIVTEGTLEQGVINLLNNAVDAGGEVRLVGRWTDDELVIEVVDPGPGFPAHVLAQGGRAPLPARSGGSGIGLFLAQGAISRLGGRLELFNTGTGGLARVELPLERQR